MHVILLCGNCKILITVLLSIGKESSHIADRLRSVRGEVLSKGTQREKYYNFVCHDSDFLTEKQR